MLSQEDTDASHRANETIHDNDNQINTPNMAVEEHLSKGNFENEDNSRENLKKEMSFKEKLENCLSQEDSSSQLIGSPPKHAAEPSVKMAGYLEKRGKMKLVSQWRRYWFVLEGRLLLYFKSHQDYAQGLSACRGSLNMGLANAVRPGSGNHATSVIEVVTRTQVLTLRTKDRGTQERWLQALLDSMALPNVIPTSTKIAGTSHFRYSMDNLPTQPMIVEKDINIPSDVCDSSLLKKMKLKSENNYYGGGSLENIVLKCNSQANLPHNEAVKRIHGRLNSSKSINKITMLYEEDSSNDFIVKNTLYDKSPNSPDQYLTKDSSNPIKEEATPKSAKHEQEFSPPCEYNEITPLMDNKKQVLDESNQNVPCQNRINPELNNNINSEIKEPEQIKYVKETTEASTNTENDYEEDYGQTFINTILNENGKDLETKEEKIEDEEDYAYYDSTTISKEISKEPDIPPRPVENESTEYSINKQKHRKNKFKLILKSKKSVSALPDNSDDVNQSLPKRKLSFLSKMFKRGRRGSKGTNNDQNDIQTTLNCPVSDSNSEPEYESVDYQAAMLGLPASKTLNDESNVTIPRVPYYGQNGMLTNEVLAEISSKIKQNKLKSSDQVSEKSWDELHHENFENETEQINKSDSPPPLLPARRENRRPSSPWHDVPTNNSPVNYYQCDAFKDSIAKFALLNLDIQDKMLGTPEGFRIIKNKWAEVESAGQWKKCQGQVSFPNKQLNVNDEIAKNVYFKEQNLVTTNEEMPSIPIKKIIEKYEKIPKHREEHIGINKTIRQSERYLGTEDKNSLLSEESLIDSLNPGLNMIDNECDRDSIEGEFTDKNEQIQNKHRPRYSDELDVLLSQLAEISSAPVLRPGVTCSLVEVGVNALLGPPRRRRHSDPDYDIPRPVRAIINNEENISDEISCNSKKMNAAERNINSQNNNEQIIEAEMSWNISMTPDSLEPVPLY